MKNHHVSHCPDYCERDGSGGVEKTDEHLLDFAGLPGDSNCCTILVQQPEGGAIMAEKLKQAEGEEELLRQKIMGLLNGINDMRLLERIYRFVKYIYIHNG